eukprot:2086727-Amphidinium_carterae.1
MESLEGFEHKFGTWLDIVATVPKYPSLIMATHLGPDSIGHRCAEYHRGMTAFQGLDYARGVGQER